jgi:GAF domain-containing protein
MIAQPFPARLTAVLTHPDRPEALFQALLPAVCEVLRTDRCFLQVRQPSRRFYRIFCWRRSPEFPDLSTETWQPEAPWETEDPMFAAALRAEPSIFVEDVETADPSLLNAAFERKSFGHRALIHGHICQDGVLWGILQPCLFQQPRRWSDFDRWIMAEVIQRLTPVVVTYSKDSR